MMLDKPRKQKRKSKPKKPEPTQPNTSHSSPRCASLTVGKPPATRVIENTCQRRRPPKSLTAPQRAWMQQRDHDRANAENRART
ncbi:hypothetical protein BDP55DRAFT_59299 [Colletotrichum godetiae]|uniref:Uncharacterized protein n=1 Tax=Colletotrichum godetiae TaxID=1209918 RepID=A0AAJ0APW2_9PEZI|nr:uncharacterized protein BDP55DRAFT_59299 [Colletotrichum godetiae]KAK1688188.1 hypothetical protein BDP55DRAFT_59299 [Colletotrichum godetiae]